MRRLVIAFAVLLSGCDLYFSGGDDEPCNFVGDEVKPAIAPDLRRNPTTGECQSAGGYPCDDRCGPCPAAEADIVDWGSCYSECDGLAEGACMAKTGCFAAYTEYPTQDRKGEFRGCWQTAPSGPIGGSCSNLDAYECSRHDNCTAHYDGTYGSLRTSPVRETFLFCGAEVGGSCGVTTCVPGTHCEEQCTTTNGQTTCKPMCVPDTNTCAQVDCGPGWQCTQVCTNGTCGAQCVPAGTCAAIATEATCKTRPDCTTVYKGEDCTCYPGYCECNVLTYERCETK
ncbi:MAG: hypothetical protein M4D80_34065 [Myxococcota bacterium]|nr:hypothetical protein [Deltaproteobacteria bacterium]MDQ3340211.1 hypothetical protein [Myxococcota bacterium]